MTSDNCAFQMSQDQNENIFWNPTDKIFSEQLRKVEQIKPFVTEEFHKKKYTFSPFFLSWEINYTRETFIRKGDLQLHLSTNKNRKHIEV